MIYVVDVLLFKQVSRLSVLRARDTSHVPQVLIGLILIVFFFTMEQKITVMNIPCNRREEKVLQMYPPHYQVIQIGERL